MWRKRVATKIFSRRFIGNDEFYSDLPPADAPPPAVSDESFLGSKDDTQFTIADHHLQDTYRIHVSSWNVGGLLPTKDLDIRDCLDIQNDDPADVYIFGFQEIVPLGAVNVLSSEDGKVSSNWKDLIRESLNQTSSSTPNNHNHDSESSKEMQKIHPTMEHKSTSSSFKCIISKQMVGIFVSVWVKSEIVNFIRGQSVACVGCGTFGCLGNKGSVSVRFWLHETSFCFVCCHLASGGKEGDEKHRNADAAEILSRTSFPIGPSSDELPRGILDHDQVIWFGDLNYRINLPEETTRSLVENEEWEILLRNDQLNVELMEGHVLEGWQEGKIDFGPTYKYYPNSNVYFGSNKTEKGQKSRAPAWCDRIIWYGKKGLKQEQYVKGDSKLSDHRPVQAIFTAQVELPGGASRGS